MSVVRSFTQNFELIIGRIKCAIFGTVPQFLTVVVPDDKPYKYPPSFEFRLKYDDTIVKMNYSTDTHITADVWNAFVVSIRKHELASVDYCESNGGATITYYPSIDKVVFWVAKYGAGGDGNHTVKIPAKICIGGLEEAANALTNWEAMRIADSDDE